jgi:hypothetical protein
MLFSMYFLLDEFANQPGGRLDGGGHGVRQLHARRDVGRLAADQEHPPGPPADHLDQIEYGVRRDAVGVDELLRLALLELEGVERPRGAAP